MKAAYAALLLAAVLSLGGCASPRTIIDRMSNAPVAGGYRGVSTRSVDVIAAARFACKARGARREKIELIEIQRARMQVVAGTNYELQMRVRQNGKATRVNAVVHSDVSGRKSLTSWR